LYFYGILNPVEKIHVITKENYNNTTVEEVEIDFGELAFIKQDGLQDRKEVKADEKDAVDDLFPDSVQKKEEVQQEDQQESVCSIN